MSRIKAQIKYLIIIFLVAIVLFPQHISAAKSYSCEYEDAGVTVIYDENGNPLVGQKLYVVSESPAILTWFAGSSSGATRITNNLSKLEPENIGKCPEKMYVCAFEYTAYNQVGLGVLWDQNQSLFYHNEKTVYLFSSIDEKEKNKDVGDLPPDGTEIVGNESADIVSRRLSYIDEYWKDSEGLGYVVAAGATVVNIIGMQVEQDIEKLTNSIDLLYKKRLSCKNINYTGSNDTYNLACPNLSAFEVRFSYALKAYKRCDKTDASCISDALLEVDTQENTIKNYCREILANYNADGGTQEDCLNSCINISDTINKAKQKAGLIGSGTGKCGFSAKLLVWVNNIMKWIKYILPVLVIVLGIIDFIKAIAADKDDEMKKAQGRFIRRLIAAALAFIIPLIIAFILDKMGFDVYSCGVDVLK